MLSQFLQKEQFPGWECHVMQTRMQTATGEIIICQNIDNIDNR